VSDCQVDHAAGTLTVWSDRPDLPEDHVAAAVSAAGYRLVRDRRREDTSVAGFVRFLFFKTGTTLTTVSGLLTLLGLVLVVAGAPPWNRTSLFALAVKTAVFALAAAGLATLWMAVVADVGASVSVILTGLRLRRMGEPPSRKPARAT
jgi:hypothetical protein